MRITQSGYITKLTEKFKLNHLPPKSLPSTTTTKNKLVKDEEKKITTEPYAALIGALQYVSNNTRPDITFTVNKLAQFMAKPNEDHWKAAKALYNIYTAPETRD